MSYMSDISLKIEREKEHNQVKKECKNCGNEYINEITDVSIGSRFPDMNVDVCCSNPELR